MKWLKSLFGSGQVRAKVTGIDEHNKFVEGTFVGSYCGQWDAEAFQRQMCQDILVKHGIEVFDIKIVAVTG